ncbi:hypothetical protein BG004_007251, partial [Podila humilis]
MGILVPRCIAANQESVYFVARGQESAGKEELLVLVKSSPNPDLSSTPTWSVVSKSTSSLFNPKLLNFERSYFSCFVDKNGAFTIKAKSKDTILYRARYDPAAPMGKFGTVNVLTSSKTNGDWVVSDMTPPAEIWNDERTWIHQESLATLFVQYPTSGDLLPPATIPTLEIGILNEAGAMVNLTLATSNITNSVGVIYGLWYGSDQLFTTLKSGTAIPSGANQAEHFNSTLVYFPFKAPFALTTPPASVESFDWNIQCRDTTSDSSAKASVINGKLYYFCDFPTPPFNTKSNMYIFDSATKVNRGPFTIDAAVNGGTDVILAPGTAGAAGYAIIHQTNGSIAIANIAVSTNDGTLSTTRVGLDFFSVSDSIQEPTPPEECGPNGCSGGGMSGTAIGLMCAGIVAFILLCVLSIFMYRKRQRQRTAPVEPPVLPVSRSHCTLDYELPTYTTTPENGDTIPDNEAVHDLAVQEELAQGGDGLALPDDLMRPREQQARMAVLPSAAATE